MNLDILIVFPLLLMQLLKEEFTLCFKPTRKETEKKAQIEVISFFLPLSVNKVAYSKKLALFFFPSLNSYDLLDRFGRTSTDSSAHKEHFSTLLP